MINSKAKNPNCDISQTGFFAAFKKDIKRGAVMAKIFKASFGKPEKFVPTLFKFDTDIKLSDTCKFPIDKIDFKTTSKGCRIEFPIGNENIFGFGLQLKKVNHSGTKKTIRSNADPYADSGDSHAPVPFFVTDKGYGIFVDTARNVSFYCGASHVHNHEEQQASEIHENEAELYAARQKEESVMLIDIPVAKGVDIYIFEGESIADIVSEYNMYSGGGCMPALWGLGTLYRCHTKSDSSGVLEFAKYFRDNHIPCDIIGIEPGWQSHAYSCTFSWDKEKFSDWQDMIAKLKADNYHINLWEHAFTNPQSPIYEDLKPYSGNYEVWEGLVPDFAHNEAAKIFAEYHRDKLVKEGISGFKLDECDGSDFTGGWSFPDLSEFPSGIDGEQMHNMFGVLYQKTLMKSFGNDRTFSEVRNSGAFAAPYPFVLYSDLYAHKDFIRGVVNSGFSGLLWAPEIRGAKSEKDFVRRLQTAVFSAQLVLNQWNQTIAPWIKWNMTAQAKKLLEIRMSLIPYLYSAFYEYHTTGRPPVRALAMDYEKDENCASIDNEYMFGDSMLIAPMTEEQEEREVYLPNGDWYDLWTKQMYSGGKTVIAKTEEIPVLVKANSVIPWATPVEYISEDTCFELTIKCFGTKGSAVLVEDDGLHNDSGYKLHYIQNEGGKVKCDLGANKRYKIVGIEQ